MKIRQHFSPQVSRDEEFGIPEPKMLAISNVLFPFTMLAVGVASAVAFALVEHLVKIIAGL